MDDLAHDTREAERIVAILSARDAAGDRHAG
jgi:hypothetical protein